MNEEEHLTMLLDAKIGGANRKKCIRLVQCGRSSDLNTYHKEE